MKYYIIAGEASGDLHGSNLMRELKKQDVLAEFRCWGGDKMEAAGGMIVKHYRDLAFMGFIEVARNIRTIYKNIAFCKQDIKAWKPDAIILIDYPGFNLRIAEWAKKEGFKVIYYISPQVWAWKENRVKTIKQSVDKMLTILPFEKQFYAERGLDVEYVGHPLLQVIDDFTEKKTDTPLFGHIKNEGTIALLPGSRRQEIKIKLPLMVEVASHFPDYSFVVAKAPAIEDSFYSGLIPTGKNLYTTTGKTYDLLYKAKAALVTSGTATLETALFNVPQIICYKGSKVSYEIAKRLIKVKYIGLVNLIMDKPVVKELIQDELSVENMVAELKDLLNNSDKKLQIQQDYAALRKILSEGGKASEQAATIITNFLKP